MALSEKARALMLEMREAALLRAEYEAVSGEHRRLLALAEEGEEIDFGLLVFLDREQRAYRKALAMRRARNWAVLSQGRAALAQDEFGARVLRLRYAVGYSWRQIGKVTNSSHTMVRRVHNRALEALVQGGRV